MTHKEMPRVSELRALIHNPSSSRAYFQDFDNSICDEPSKKRVWLAREQEFQQLDPESWRFLMEEAHPRLTEWDAKGRGWEQLISILNQARAHNYLVDKGCLQVRFIPRAKVKGQKTPDLEAELNGKKALCEVKTINISDVEADRRKKHEAISIKRSLEKEFFKKLMSTLETAKEQMVSYDTATDPKCIAFVVINFDDLLAEYKKDYFEQIDRHLAENPISGIDIVFYNQITAFHFSVDMHHANVVNEYD